MRGYSHLFLRENGGWWPVLSLDRTKSNTPLCHAVMASFPIVDLSGLPSLSSAPLLRHRDEWFSWYWEEEEESSLSIVMLQFLRSTPSVWQREELCSGLLRKWRAEKQTDAETAAEKAAQLFRPDTAGIAFSEVVTSIFIFLDNLF